MGRPLSAAFRALRDGRHPVKENGNIQGAKPLPDFAGWQSSQPEPAPTLTAQEVEDKPGDWMCDGDPALLAFANSPGTVPIGHSDPFEELEDVAPDLGIGLFDDEEFDYDPLGLGLAIA